MCLTASLPRPAVQVRVTSAPRRCVSPRETRLPSSHLMQMLQSPGLVQACRARQTRLKCDETEWSEPLRGFGSWLRCVCWGGLLKGQWNWLITISLRTRSEGWVVPPLLLHVPTGRDGELSGADYECCFLCLSLPILRSLSVLSSAPLSLDLFLFLGFFFFCTVQACIERPALLSKSLEQSKKLM